MKKIEAYFISWIYKYDPNYSSNNTIELDTETVMHNLFLMGPIVLLSFMRI